MGIDYTPTCDFLGCGAKRGEVNKWFVVVDNSSGVHIYHWDQCPADAMQTGKHFCGIAHTIQTVSNMLTPDSTDVNRESTLELKPPLSRDGTAPQDKPVEQVEE